MKPSTFEYIAPRSVDEAVQSLTSYAGAAKVLAGGQSLVPLMNLRLAAPEVLIDINGLQELGGLGAWDGGLSVGALVRQSTLERADLVRQRLPLLAEASALVGHPANRHRGTVGGSLAHADPAAELPAAMLAVDATFIVRGARGIRSLAATDFFSGYLTTTLEPDELLTEIRAQGVPSGTGSAFLEMSRRSGDFALCGAAALVTLNASGRCDRVRVALCGVGIRPVRARRVEEALVGELPAGRSLEDAAQLVVQEIDFDPPSDIHGSAAYRRKLAIVMIRRVVELAAQRSGASYA